MLKSNIFSNILLASLILFWALPVFAQNPDSIPFVPAVNYGAGVVPYSVFCSDLDGDGDLDLAVANYNSDDISILKNNGDGTFQTAVNYGAGVSPYSVFCADLDGDGDLDLAVTNYNSDNVSILKNNGDGSFQIAENFAVGDAPTCVFCADLDGDGDLDLAAGNAGNYSVSILKNNGNGTFHLDSNYVAGDYPHSVFCADLDGDGDLDLAVANRWSANASTLMNNGDGTFQSAVNYGVQSGPVSVFCADVDKDSDLDLVLASLGYWTNFRGDVSILKNNGNGTFQSEVVYGTGYSFGPIFCADLDNDSDMELAVGDYMSGKVYILDNNSDGTFQTPISYIVGGTTRSVFCADLDNDGDLDVAVANSGGVSILKNLTVRKPVDLSVDIVGRSQIRVNAPQNYLIRYSNFGLVTSNDVMLFLELHPPDGFDLKYDIGLDTLPLEGLDSFTVKKDLDMDSMIVMPIWIAPIPAGSWGEIQLGLEVSDRVARSSPQPDDILNVYLKYKQAPYQACAEAGRELYEKALDKYGIEVYSWQDFENLYQQKLQEYRNSSLRISFWDILKDILLTAKEQGLVSSIMTVGDAILITSQTMGYAASCFLEKLRLQQLLKPITPVRSIDPNDKSSVTGYGAVSHFVAAEDILNYIVFFENVDSATADAEDIIIVDTLDQNLDWSTLQIGSMSHPVPCSASFDAINGIITWTCDSIMLPPDTLPPNGEGWVSFSIKPKSYLSSGTQIKNRASIKFDYNPWMYAPMDSSYIVNTIDAGRPTSSVTQLPDTANFPNFTVSWSGSDDPSGSGIAAYTIYAKTDGGPYLPWLTDTTVTSAVFHGELGHTYYFSCTAVDNVGYREERHPSFDARTTVRVFLRGDPNKDGKITVADAVYLINYLFKGGPAPIPLASGDVNCDGKTTVADVVYLINYLFKGGPPPC